ncbi:hypothetical protein EZV73_05620 [Acidaminobacter sp. JC074]|uniref:beta-L-arabinofuranosidase domain-containing protein n=1 Tax=Acidaminobacter sp. JC074 TaxID=2530199 RepID=UPI001F0DD760|nr:beta-L-arabinofuranosidase domain-containing protein [Acidaminobacter sp. JC074]MCH4887036.1 hypothetical protein [Acidaminobacter sp. JC074]
MNNQFEKLPLGTIEAGGWLRNQLEIQAAGLTGHIEDQWSELKDNGWKGGRGESWERGPYYLDGLVPLAYTLKDENLIQKAQVWIEWILKSQDHTGLFGPKSIITVNSDLDKNQDWWHFMIVLKVLTQYHEATGDERVLPFMDKFFEYMYANIEKQALYGWAQARGAELLLSISWLRKRLNKPYLESLSNIIINQTTDWIGLFSDFPFWRKVDRFHWNSHVVNVAMGIKFPGVVDETRGSQNQAIVDKGIESLMTYHGQAHGMFSGDEWLSGTSPSQGLELCAVVEYMYAMEELTRIYGHGKYVDILEKAAFNALPGTISYDFTSHQYDQQVNQVICNRAERPWSNRDDSNMFGLEPNFGCCTANMHQGWPKFVSHTLMKSDKGYVVNSYVPVKFKDKDFELRCDSDYPFRDKAIIKIVTGDQIELRLRIPTWCHAFGLESEGKKVSYLEENGYALIKVKSSQTFEVSLKMSPKQVNRGSSTTVQMGPLVYVLPIKEDWRQVVKRDRFHDYEIYPMSKWQYGLKDQTSFEVMHGKINKQAFSDKPVSILVKGHFLPEWGLKNNSAEDPYYHYEVETDQETIELVPYGCTKLRIGEFPLIRKF